MKHHRHRHGPAAALLTTAAGFLAGAALESALRTQRIAQLDQAHQQVERQLQKNAGEGACHDGQ